MSIFPAVVFASQNQIRSKRYNNTHDLDLQILITMKTTNRLLYKREKVNSRILSLSPRFFFSPLLFSLYFLNILFTHMNRVIPVGGLKAIVFIFSEISSSFSLSLSFFSTIDYLFKKKIKTCSRINRND